MDTEQGRAPPSAGISQASTPAAAVFLSYASQDEADAERIATALRAAGIEVWFDKSELRGGDAWDRSIRQQIRECALFVPVISTHTDARREGYFRREWKLAVDRTHDMSERMAFLVPVVIDDTSDSRADVPDRFREVQWTRLPAGEASAAFVERVRRLLSPEWAPAPARAARSTLASGAPLIPRHPRHWTGLLYGAIAAAVLLVVGYFGLERLNRSMPSAGPVAVSIAVLPLANESGEANQQYFSDGISEDLITALSQFPTLKVIGRTSSFQFRDSKEDSRSIGAKLGVAHLLEGSVQRSGDVVRVSTELIDTADGRTQWSARYDRPYKDLFALQDEITRAVVGALRAKLLPGEHAAAQSERPPSGSLEAYNLLLQGRFYRVSSTEVAARKAIDFLTSATQLDPNYALAWSELSWAWTGLGQQWLGAASAQEAYAKARAATDRALALAPDLAAAHLSRAWLLFVADFDWQGAQLESRRALALAPDYSRAKLYLADELAGSGQLDQAVDLVRQALSTDPLHANWHDTLGLYLLGLNRLDEAEAAIRKAIELQPNAQGYRPPLVMIAILRGDAQAAMATAQQEPPGNSRDFALALARQVGGDRTAAEAALKLLIDKYADQQPYEIATVYALRQEPDKTFEWLDRAWTNRDAGITGLLYDPFILRYKDDPRFAAFCRKVGLPTPAEAGRRA
jgi:TolB-like protein/Tfp pilus assembly protein PilF